MFHVKVQHAKSLLSAMVAETAGLSIAEALQLMSLGAIYYQPALATEGKPRRALHDMEVHYDDYIRIHTNPRRYPIAHEIDWMKRIMAETEHFLVINKPGGVPSHAIMENLHENVIECMKTCLTQRGVEQCSLYLPQRLDVETSGVMVLVKTSSMIAKYNDWLKKDRIRKYYKALLSFSVIDPRSIDVNTKVGGVFAEGDVVKSYLERTTVAPKKYFWQQNEANDLQECILRIDKILPPIIKTRLEWLQFASEKLQADEERDVKDEDLRGKLRHAIQQWMTSGDPAEYIALQELTVELITGRTHQVRGQLQLLSSHLEASRIGKNFHLAGDNLYHGCTSEHIAIDDNSHTCPYLTLQACGLTVNSSVKGFDKSMHFSLQQPWWHLLHQEHVSAD